MTIISITPRCRRSRTRGNMVLLTVLSAGLIVPASVWNSGILSGGTYDPARPVASDETGEPVDPAPIIDAALLHPADFEFSAGDGAEDVLSGVFIEELDTIRPSPIDKDSEAVLEVGSVEDLAQKFAALDYSVREIREGDALVPRVFVASFPEDLDGIETIDQRKSLFFKTMLPLVLRANEQVQHDRWRLLGLRERIENGRALTRADRRWLAALAEEYRLDEVNIDELLLRVDIVPPSMALAQAVVESGWGRSRFAQEANAVFGQITIAETGIVSEADGQRFASFPQLLDGTESYVRNLNTHRAYADFRALRAQQRASGGRLDGSELLAGLLRYSELGQDYINYVRGVIDDNDLAQFDRARLAVPESQVASVI